VDNLWFLFKGGHPMGNLVLKNDFDFNSENGIPKITKNYMGCSH